jgi:hypothetical protein
MKRKQFPPGPLKLPDAPTPQRGIVRFVLFMLWQSIIHRRGR